MNARGSFIRRHPFACFYGLAIAFPTLLFTYMVVLETMAPNMFGPGVGIVRHFYATMAQLHQSAPLLTQHRDSVLIYLTLYAMIPLASPFLFFPFAPTVSALAMTGLARGGAAVRALLGAYAPLRGALGWRDGVRIYGTLLLVLASLIGAAMLYDSLFQGGARLAKMQTVWGLAELTLFSVGWAAALFLNQGGLLEELGWRGYAWPVLVRKLRQPLTAAIVLGVAWALWHLPREIPTLLSGELSLQRLLVGQALFISSCIGMTLVAVAFVNVTGGSVLPAIMIHGTLNTLHIGFEVGRSGVRSEFTLEPPVLWVMAGLLTLLVMGRDLGWGRRMQIHGGDGRSDPANLWAPARR
jgi:membrane protease YdiL (CAAX protease family)